jgi:radical SAM protein with 4Fe4S-binding SPASM domain
LSSEGYKYFEHEEFIYPKLICIETYHGCNARCGFCPVSLWPRQKGPMSDTIFNTIICQLSDWGPEKLKQVALMMNGEPLLDKKLEERLLRCKREKLPNVGFTTNASLMDSKRALSIINASPDYVVFSFDTLDKKTYEGNRVGLSYDVVLKNVVGFIEKRNEANSDIRVVLRYVDFKDEGSGFDEYCLWFRQILKEDLDEVQYTRMHNAGFRPSIKTELVNGDFGINPCGSPFNRMIIQSNGQVSLCAHDFNADYKFGNIMDQHVLEIFNCERFREVRKMHKAHKRNTLLRCSTCDEPEIDLDGNTFLKYTPSAKLFFNKSKVGFDYDKERKKVSE